LPETRYCQVALDTPLRQTFDYRLPEELAHAEAGMRVQLPFGRQTLVGLILRVSAATNVPADKLRDATALLDASPLLSATDLRLLEWAADYYHHPIGEVVATALPRLLRTVRKRKKKEEQPATIADAAPIALREAVHTLGDAQAAAVNALRAARGSGNFLLDGVTGSGKTEVYLQACADVLAQGGSVLVLCPEIGLTPQLLERFEQRFDTSIASLHSGLTDTGRARAWQQAASGAARIVIGTRSAVFTPIPGLALIIVDEEHDPSYKQQDGGFRYSARDLALMRGQMQKVPVVLGSATPSLESLRNAQAGRLTMLQLPERAGSAVPPKLILIDMHARSVHKGFAAQTLEAMRAHLERGAQILLFLNRRGYAPTLLCHGCGWVAPCESCDARMTVHMRRRRLNCHHCGADEPMPQRCPRCGHEVHPLGSGTERVEETLAEMFPDHPVERFDRDVLRAAGELHEAIERVHSGEARILVGTQMLTKGHHFPDVTLVVVLNADQSLFATDFRAAERLAQTIVQVAGRAGRADRPGEVLIQSQFPENPLLKTLLDDGYAGFAASALAEREAAHWPPFARMALLRASDTTPDGAMRFLAEARVLLAPPEGVVLQPPVPATMARRAGRTHAQMLVESPQRVLLQRFLADWVPRVTAMSAPRSLRWALDVDPLDVF
jgi:primosomal protein N' (replication factor Y) (superfamily II helicase)